jgi:hypothetical protein
MPHEASAIFIALEHSPFAAAIRQSDWLYPAANVGHILSLVIFAGAVAVMDVRLLGGFAATAPGRLIDHARRFAIAALVGMAATGFMLFAAEASHLVLNPMVKMKALLIGAGLANAATYEFWIRGAVAKIEPGGTIPSHARTAALLSIGIWLAVAACGRSIAYF